MVNIIQALKKKDLYKPFFFKKNRKMFRIDLSKNFLKKYKKFKKKGLQITITWYNIIKGTRKRDNNKKEGKEVNITPEAILKKAEEITEVSPRRWEKYGKVRYYFNYGNNKTIYFSFSTNGTVEAGANRPGATSEIFRTLEEIGMKLDSVEGNKSFWKK